MNFLAHLYLSGNDEDIRLGNFIGDYVKGNDYITYPEKVRKGILLHRKIDNFTDKHTIVRNHKTLFYPKYHKYSGVVTDILYDHFLSTHWNRFSDEPFNDYIDRIYEWINTNVERLPLDMQKIIPSLVKNQWLSSYNTLEGIENVLIGMSKGTSLPLENDFAMFIIHKHYNELKHDFLQYFEELVFYVNHSLEDMSQKK